MSGYALYPGPTSYPGATTYPGVLSVGIAILAFIDLGAPTVASPNWTGLGSGVVRQFSCSRGRETELSVVDAGTALLTVDNRTRDFDPLNTTGPYYPYVRPMTRFRIVADIGGVEYPVFVGYAQAIQQKRAKAGKGDQWAEIDLVDEFKVLALDRLPVSSPPRDSYQALVESDNPSAYWTLDEDPATLVAPPRVTVPVPEGPETTTRGGRPGYIGDTGDTWGWGWS